MTSNTSHKSQQANIYDPLPDGPYTRVLILEPGRLRQPLRCRLKVVNLEERPDFEAISYVWGRGIKRKKVVCNGIRIKITPNLLQALLAVRYPSTQRIVWADSISINQNDGKEKGHQVAMMGPIFNRARRVIIHLAGDDRGHAHRVATFVSEILALVRQKHTNDLKGMPKPSIEHEIDLAVEDTRMQSFKYLLDHPWFDRGWVIQEALLTQDTIVIWGLRETAGMTSLMIFCNWLPRNFRGFQACLKYGLPYPPLAQLYPHRFCEVAQGIGHPDISRTQPNLPRILDIARTLGFKDPRDRVYAFLYLDRLEDQRDIAIDAASRLSIQPDYSKTVAEVYADFARYITESGDITWLTYARNTQASLAKSGWASWIPRWDVIDNDQLGNPNWYPIMQPSQYTSEHRWHKIARFDGNCMIVTGVVFDRIRASQFNSSTRSLHITLDDVACFWRMATTSNLEHAYSPDHLHLALLKTLTQSTFYGPLSQWMKEQEMFWDLLRAAEEGSAMIGSLGARIPEIEQFLSMTTNGRKLVSTERGYFGLAPRATEDNDVCCIIFGCPFPFILREVGNPTVAEPRRYRVIGDAWVAGKQPVTNPAGSLYMPSFGQKNSMEWETWGLEQVEITLI